MDTISGSCVETRETGAKRNIQGSGRGFPPGRGDRGGGVYSGLGNVKLIKSARTRTEPEPPVRGAIRTQ